MASPTIVDSSVTDLPPLPFPKPKKHKCVYCKELENPLDDMGLPKRHVSHVHKHKPKKKKKKKKPLPQEPEIKVLDVVGGRLKVRPQRYAEEHNYLRQGETSSPDSEEDFLANVEKDYFKEQFEMFKEELEELQALDGLERAEDGRRQSKAVNGVLPPLNSRGTMGRETSLGPLETAPHDGHWKLERRSLSESTDQKIISHLRRQLNKRLEKRMQELISTELSDHSDDDAVDGKQAESRHTTAIRGGVSSLLNNYDELGEKKGVVSSQPHPSPRRHQRKLEPLAPDEPAAKNGAIPVQQPVLPNIGERQSSSDSAGRPKLRKSVSMSEDEPEILNKEEFRKRSAKLKEQKSPEVAITVEYSEDAPQPELTKEKSTLSDHETDQEIQYLSREETDMDNESFSSLEVSPVPTPMVYRPETREAQRYSYEERVARILKGSMNIKVPADSKILRIYVSSAFTDSIGERSRLIQKAYPDLKEYCSSRGYELHIMDLHWGVTSWQTDDHTGPDKAMQVLEKCTEGARTISFVTFLSQTYGPSLLPTSIPADEFQLILKEVEKDFEIQRRLTQQRMVALREAQLARQRKQSSEGTEEEEDGEDGADDETKDTERVASVTKNHEKTVRFSVGELKSSKQGDGSADSTLLTQWYLLDENTVPPVYKLQRISTHIKDILRNDPAVKQAAKRTWQGMADKMVDIFQNHAKNLLTDPRDRQKYFQSAVDKEIETGLLYADSPDNTCLWYDRFIPDIYSHLGETKVKDFIDLRSDIAEIDPSRAELLENLRAKMADRVPKKNIRFSEVNWSSEGLDERVRAHDKYFEKVAVDFRDTMLQRLESLVKEDKKRYTWKIQLYEEVAKHVDFCHERARQFHGRKELLNTIKRYIRSKYRHPLVVHGRSGSGKTSLLSKAAKDTHKWFKGKNSITVVRMIGVTSASTNIRLLLKDICTQLCVVFGNDPEELPDDYKGIMNDFSSRMSQATEDQPIILYIDSLNQLSADFDAHRITWLPKELPEHVHLIVSTLPDDRYESYSCLKSAFPKEANFVEVPQMREGDAAVLLEHWLKTANRGLTNEQFDIIIDAFKKCPLPLYLKISYEEALLWPSYMALEKVKLSETIKKAVSVMFARLESTHGQPLVRRALGYLTAAKNGVTENEMEDLLSLDDSVMEDISKQIKTPLRRCPVVSWLRLRLDLKDYIVERSADNCKPLKWFQSQFVEAAEERYLSAKERPSYHKAIAEYFQGVWSEGKPVGSSETVANRFVSPQNLYEEVQDADGNTSRVYNRRKLSELPYNLLKAVMFDDMKTQTLCNFEFLLAKLCADSLRSILDDFQMALQTEPDDADLKLVAHTLHLSTKALKRDKHQLATQVVGRLQEIVSKDVPVSHADPRKFPFLHPLFRQAVNASVPSLIPSMACLTQPDGILFDLLSGHREPITAVANTTDGLRALTTSKDDTLKIWDLRQGRVTKTIRDVGANCHMIRTAVNNSLIITSESSMIRIWSMRTGECVKVIDEYVDPAHITLAKEGSILAAFYDGTLILRTWSLKPHITKLVEVKLHQEEEDSEAGLMALHKEHCILAANTGHGVNVLSAFRSASYAMVHSAKTGAQIFTLKSSDPGASVTAVAVSREYFVVACRYQYMKHHEIFYLELFDAQNGSYLRKIRGCTVDDIKDLMVNQMGSHALCVCGSEQNNTSNIAIWNLETEDHKHLASHATVSSMGACSDLRYVLTGSKTENILRIWNMSKSVNQTAPKLKTKEGIKNLYAMKDHPRYVVAESFEKGVIYVWNITRDKFTGQIVRKERGLIDKQDVILFRNERAVILADRAISSVSEDNQQVYQTLFVYNLVSKKYERKIKDCFIVPSPAHEFKVLSEDRLMGLSENRSHFMIWNMKNGHVAHRIRPNFRDMERRRLEWGIRVKQEPGVKDSKPQRSTTAMMTPWDRRTETEVARRTRKQKESEEEKKRMEELKKEKENGIEQYILSGDEKIIVASFFAHHLCVFNVDTHEHMQTLEDENSMLYLYVSALTHTGSHLVLANYDEEAKTSYVTLWDCKTGEIRKRLKNEKNVRAMAINDAADRIVFGKETTEMRIWDPTRSNSLRRVKGYKDLKFGVNSKILLLNNGERAAVFAGDISMWDLDKGEMLSVFTPDMNIQSLEIAMDGQLIVFGLRDIAKVVTLRMSKGHRKELEIAGKDIFGEKEESSDDDSDEEEDAPAADDEDE
ncbi:uncharacterized protein LOC135492092 isoform X2 [Lineus longissimus]|uniref:uncharacterized protein LOC135492092 isoform X2 n=1 Tax=Lineus longissimus TaxID=88925 RepID=UPI00315D1895